MSTEITVPTLGESVTEATVAKWFKAVGEAVAADEPVLELETDKVTLEINAPAAGTLSEILADEGADVEVGTVLGMIAEGKAAAKALPPRAASGPSAPKPEPQPAPVAESRPSPSPSARPASPAAAALSPAVRRLVDQHALDPAAIPGTGKDGRLTKGDVLAHLEARKESAPESKSESAPSAPEELPQARPGRTAMPAGETPWQESPSAYYPPRPEGPREERVRMSRLRRRIAERLKESQNTAATLTTYNECDMSAVIALRGRYRDAFEKRYGVRLGFMSFFVKACVVALREFPVVNASIEGDEIVYKNHYDIGVAVGVEEGLVVPVVRDADALSFAQIELAIADLASRARDGKLSLEELQGGTFTVSNAGIYGSLNSMPILNTPQSGILGMHRIQQRPVVLPDGPIAARPMMYLALSYDHRLVDGRQAVSFLVRVRDCIEAPDRIMLDV